MLTWDQQAADHQKGHQPTTGEGPYPPPQRPCLVCGQEQWRWNEETELYECASGDPTHTERERWTGRFAREAPEAD